MTRLSSVASGFAPLDTVAGWWQRRASDVVWMLGMGFAAVVVGAMTARTTTLRVALAVAGIALAAGLGARAGKGLIYAVVVWTALMGTIRRMLSVVSSAGHADPLLLVAATAIIVLTVAAAQRGAFRNRSTLASAVLALNLLAVLEAFNPLQHGLKAGVTALLFALVPVLAFWVGRGLCDDRTLMWVLRLLAGLGVLAAVYGLVQTFGSFPSWDKRWIQSQGQSYVSLNVNGVIRAFASFASAQEYAVFLGVGLVIWVAWLRPSRVVLAAAAIGVVSVALFYESSRTPVVTAAFAIALMIAARRMRKPAGALILGMALLFLLPVAISHFAGKSSNSTTSNSSSPAGQLAAHQVTGLANPFASTSNENSSTLSGHLGQVTSGLGSVVHYPFGQGASSVNIAGANTEGSNTTPSTTPPTWPSPSGCPDCSPTG